jgi:streptogramin lyase
MPRKSCHARRFALLALALAAFAAPLFAATVEVILGPGARGPAGAIVLRNPFGVIRDADGSIWWCEYDAHVIRRLDQNGTVALVAGTGTAGYSGDGGPATEARLDQPHEIRLDREGHLYFTDTRNHAVRRVDRNSGRISTVAGTGRPGNSGDGELATKATLRQPHSLQFDPVGNLYIGDTGNHVLRRVDRATGRITTIAGTGKPGPTPDSAPLEGTPLNGPRAIEFDSSGRLWLATREGNQLFRIDLKQRRIERKAGTGEKGPGGDGGPAMDARLTGPKGVAVEAGSGGRVRGVILVDTESHTLRRLDLDSGRIDRVLGTGQKGDAFDRDPLKCALARPHGVWVEADGGLLVGDSENHRILRVQP